MPIIELDSKIGKEFGFTSDKFDGYLWQDNEVLLISFIESLQPHQGNLRKLFDTIEEKGFTIIVPTPSIRMEGICNMRGMEKILLNYDNEQVECMTKID